MLRARRNRAVIVKMRKMLFMLGAPYNDRDALHLGTFLRYMVDVYLHQAIPSTDIEQVP